MTVDLEYVHRCVMSVLAEIASSSVVLEDRVSIKKDAGRKMKVEEALVHGVTHLHGPFHDEYWEIVERAFARFSTTPPSRQIDECCRELLRLMSKQPAMC